MWTGAGWCALVAALLVGLPVRGGLGATSWAEESVPAAVALYELSPTTYCLECAGVDWARREPVYHAAGTDWFPADRRAWRGSLAAPLLFVVGSLATLIAQRVSHPWSSGSTSAPSPRT